MKKLKAGVENVHTASKIASTLTWNVSVTQLKEPTCVDV
jgi:hypothetical protein